MNFATDTNDFQLTVGDAVRVRIGSITVPVRIVAIGPADVHGDASVVVHDAVRGSRIRTNSKNVEVL